MIKATFSVCQSKMNERGEADFHLLFEARLMTGSLFSLVLLVTFCSFTCAQAPTIRVVLSQAATISATGGQGVQTCTSLGQHCWCPGSLGVVQIRWGTGAQHSTNNSCAPEFVLQSGIGYTSFSDSGIAVPTTGTAVYEFHTLVIVGSCSCNFLGNLLKYITLTLTLPTQRAL